MTTVNMLITILGISVIIILFLIIKIIKLNSKIEDKNKLIEYKDITISKHIRSLELSEEVYKNYKRNIKNKIEKLSINSLYDLKFYLAIKYEYIISKSDVEVICNLYFKSKKSYKNLEVKFKNLNNIDDIIKLLKEKSKINN